MQTTTHHQLLVSRRQHSKILQSIVDILKRNHIYKHYHKKTRRSKRGGRHKKSQTQINKCVTKSSIPVLTETRFNFNGDLKVGLINAQSCCEKTLCFHDLIRETKIDILCIVETWLKDRGYESIVDNLTPENYTTQSFPRRNRGGGGIAFVYRSNLNFDIKCQQVSQSFSSFEAAEISLSYQSKNIKLIAVYRPDPHGKNTTPFLNELSEMLTMYDMESNDYVLVGDFNIHFDRQVTETERIKTLFDEHRLTQHVKTATHKLGHILDWVVTSESLIPTSPVSVLDKCISDHFFINFTIPFQAEIVTKTKRTIIETRNLRQINMTDFKEDIRLELSKISDAVPTVESFVEKSRAVLDVHAPLIKRKVKERKPSPWYTNDVKRAKTEKRKAEAKWRRSGKNEDRELYILYKNKYKKIITTAKKKYYENKFAGIKDSKQFFRLTDALLGKRKTSELPTKGSDDELAERFADYFIEKVANIRNSLEHHNVDTEQSEKLKPVTRELTSFREVTKDDIRKLVISSPNKSCELDSIPTNLLKASVEEIAPFISEITNKSLKSGVFPDVLKKALVRPLLKKHGLDPNEMKNYRPVSNLSFLSKLMERVVLGQLCSHLTENGLNEVFQSAYRRFHSTETALLRVANDLFNVIDGGDTTVLCLLDLSAAFDTIDHKILLRRLECTFGIKGAALKWFASYLEHRIQSVVVRKSASSERTIPFGVPQGSVLGPVLFVLYTMPLGEIIRGHHLGYHCYADDTQIYSCNGNMSLESKAHTSESCIGNIKEWMGRNRLKLNSEKTVALVVGGRKRLQNASIESITIDGENIKIENSAKNLGVTFDSEMSMDVHVKNLKRKLIIELRRIYLVRNFLTTEACQKLVVSVIFSNLDYCNALLFGTSSENIKKLQGVQNNAARLVLRKRRRDPASPLLEKLHWLPVKERIKYKAATLLFKCLDGSAPAYIQQLVCINVPKRTLRSSSDKCIFTIPRIRLKAGEKTFSHFGPTTWNALPPNVRNSSSLEIFKKKLKTFYFGSHFRGQN